MLVWLRRKETGNWYPVADQIPEAGQYGKNLPQSSLPQRVHVGIWYILRAQKGSHIPTLRPKYVLYSYMDPLGSRSIGALDHLRNGPSDQPIWGMNQKMQATVDTVDTKNLHDLNIL